MQRFTQIPHISHRNLPLSHLSKNSRHKLIKWSSVYKFANYKIFWEWAQPSLAKLWLLIQSFQRYNNTRTVGSLPNWNQWSEPGPYLPATRRGNPWYFHDQVLPVEKKKTQFRNTIHLLSWHQKVSSIRANLESLKQYLLNRQWNYNVKIAN